VSAPLPQESELVAGNTFDKYGSRNPVHRRFMRRFLADASQLVTLAPPSRVLEVGCGSGELAGALFGGRTLSYHGVDLSPEEVARAQAAQPHWKFQVASADKLPYPDAQFDLVVACEILEHVHHPQRAVDELARVCNGHLLVSVPWEPVWRLANLARGAYVRQFGNTPGHLQHFSRRAIRSLVRRRFDLLQERRPFPWTMLLARSRPAPEPGRLP
jgi:ubiquinone/menaquinone biosynthesis C-methylase UbiE